MNTARNAMWRWLRAVALGGAALLAGCATLPFDQAPQAGPQQQLTAADDDDESLLVAQLRSDLHRFNSRETARTPAVAPAASTSHNRDTAFADRARSLFAPLSGSSLRMPVVGVNPRHLSDSWHDPRDGGARLHTGIDIFAPKGTAIVAVTDGIVSYIGDQPKGGHCLWLTTENGASFYYAHLDRWAPGLYEGMEVQSGDLLGFVGNTGNAIHTPSHLHFGINENDEMVNPYPLLAHAAPTLHARTHSAAGGGSVATR